MTNYYLLVVEPHIIGLTGGIASGKTTVSDRLTELGAYCIDTDIIARQVVEIGSPTLKRIHDIFGNAFFTSNGSLNRPEVKRIIFNDVKQKIRYETIIHPAIRQATLDAITDSPKSAPYVLVVVPLLFEKGFDEYTDKNIVVDIPEDIQIARAVKRKPSDESIIRNIITQQMSREEKIKRADFVIKNDKDLPHLFTQVDALHQKLIAL